MRVFLIIMGLYYGLYTDEPDAHEHAFILLAGAFVLCFVSIGDTLKRATDDERMNMFLFHVGDLALAFFKRFLTKGKDEKK